MVILDLNQVMLANFHQQNRGADIDENLIRHMVLNSIRMYNKKFKNDYGHFVIACDDTNNWRKDYFPYYKANRKKARDESALDWNMIFSVLNGIREDLKQYFPYTTLQVPRAEADDIIGSLCRAHGVYMNNSTTEKILIISSDKDFAQLQKYSNVEQFSPIQKKFIRCNNPARVLFEHILRGDVGDGVPNFLSPDNVLVTPGARQKPVMTKKIEQWNGKEPEQFCTEEMLRGYRRNEIMIDLDKIPDTIYNQVIEAYDIFCPADRSRMFSYFMKHRLKNLFEVIDEF